MLALPFAFGVVCLVLLQILSGWFATCFPALSGALDWCLCRCPGPQGTYRGACLAGVPAWARPTSASAGAQLAAAGELRPGPVPGLGPVPGRSCLVRRWVRPRAAAKPAAQCKAAREPAPTARPAPTTELRLVLALRLVRAWVSSLHRTCL